MSYERSSVLSKYVVSANSDRGSVMSLDERLRDVLFKAAGGISDMGDDEVAQIKQAFADEGWTPIQRVGFRPDKEGFIERYPALMTGQEWYDRFVEECKRIPDGKHPSIFDPVYEAAKKAAGIE